MTKEQFEHYIKGGKFKAIYKPIEISNLSKGAVLMIDTEITVYQNILTTPIEDDAYVGQHCFNSIDILGWFPEQDIKILEILGAVIPNVEPLPQYMYRLYYTTQEQINQNFGNTKLTPPFRAARSYARNMDNHVMGMSIPQASKIEKAVWKGEYKEKIEWKVIHQQETVIKAEDVFDKPEKPKYNVEEQDSLT